VQAAPAASCATQLPLEHQVPLVQPWSELQLVGHALEIPSHA
jgi:hypothetical protein